MVIIKASNSIIADLLQVSQAHQSDANSNTSNLSTFLSQPSPKFVRYTTNADNGTPGTFGVKCNLDFDNGILSVREGNQAVQETSKDNKLTSCIF